MRTLVLFTRDLRVKDHPALTDACAVSDEIVPLFVFDPSLTARSPNRMRFLSESLADLDRSLARRGGVLFLRTGDPAVEATALARAASCSRISLTSDVGTYAASRERALTAAARGAGVQLVTFPGHSVVEPGDVTPTGRGAYRVFTPYFRAWTAMPRRAALPAPPRVAVPDRLDPGPRVDPVSVHADAWDIPLGGERAARRAMHAFVSGGVADYETRRDDMAADATSRLSPYLRFGCLSPNEVAEATRDLPGSEAFLRQLAWRDFFLQLLADDPSLAWLDMRPLPEGGPPVADELIDAWRLGRTGLPLVDAAMRQLLREGWIHNRARMVAASFLTRRMGVAWQVGERHFARHLVDGEPANNAGNWQWVAGTGTDPRRGRTLNPVRQAQRFDPSGAYVRRYVRELEGVPAPAIFAPWTEPELLAATGYPAPVLEVRVERARPRSAASKVSAAARTSSPR